MTEVKNDEASLLTKRKPDLVALDKDDTQEKADDMNKKQKVDVSSTDNIHPSICEAKENKAMNGEEQTSIHGDNGGKDVDDEDEDDEDDEEEVCEDEDDDEEDDSDDDDSNGKAEMVDRKGKGIMMDDKGKGKMIEESEEDSSELGSDSDGDGDGGEDSDLSDDPLAEVDLDNILPTRTRSRSRVSQPGIRMSDSQGSKRVDGDN